MYHSLPIELPSDPDVTSNALAIQIVFPLVGVTPAERRPGKLKKAESIMTLPSPCGEGLPYQPFVLLLTTPFFQQLIIIVFLLYRII